MESFLSIIGEAVSSKVTAGGTIIKMSDSHGGKLSMMINKNKDMVTVSLNNEMYVATDNEASAIIKLFK